jgi:hypothetical protein
MHNQAHDEGQLKTNYLSQIFGQGCEGIGVSLYPVLQTNFLTNSMKLGFLVTLAPI